MAPMISKILVLLSALSSAVGTYLMYRYSVTLAQFSAYMSPKLVEEVKAANAKRLKGQRIGLALLIAGIVLACVSAFI
jgi:hypothetical protein